MMTATNSVCQANSQEARLPHQDLQAKALSECKSKRPNLRKPEQICLLAGSRQSTQIFKNGYVRFIIFPAREDWIPNDKCQDFQCCFHCDCDVYVSTGSQQHQTRSSLSHLIFSDPLLNYLMLSDLISGHLMLTP